MLSGEMHRQRKGDPNLEMTPNENALQEAVFLISGFIPNMGNTVHHMGATQQTFCLRDAGLEDRAMGPGCRRETCKPS